MVSRPRRLSFACLGYKDSDKGPETQSTDLDQEHANQLAPDIVSRGYRLGKDPVTTDHGHGRKEMVKVGPLCDVSACTRGDLKKRT